MAFCRKCGKQITENSCFCPYCGAYQTTPAAAQDPYFDPNRYGPPQPPKASVELNLLHLIWAILHLLFGCRILGAISLIFVVMAKDAPTEEKEKYRIKIARNCNIIATVILGILILLSVIFSAFILSLLDSLGIIIAAAYGA